MKSPEVSVLIPSYNRSKFVTKAIDSVLAQTYQNLEIIVVDSSTDDTRKALRAYGDKVRCIYQEPCGVSNARNLGVKEAQGRWVAFLDSDDEWLPQKLEVQMDQIEKRSDLCAHITNIVFHALNGHEVELFALRGFVGPQNEAVVFERPLIPELRYQLAFSSCLLAKREALIAAGLFDSRLTLHEDLDVAFRLALQGPWGVSKLPLVHMFRRDEPPVNLSNQHVANPIYSYETLVHIYSKLKDQPRLERAERREVSKELSGARFSLGVELYKSGRAREARSSFLKVFNDHASLKTAAKYLLSVLPWSIGLDMLFVWAAFARKGFRRSTAVSFVNLQSKN